MPALDSRKLNEQQIEQTKCAAQKAIERPVKLSDTTEQQSRPVMPHILQSRIRAIYASDLHLSNRSEKWIQAFGVVVILAACYVIGVALYAKL